MLGEDINRSLLDGFERSPEREVDGSGVVANIGDVEAAPRVVEDLLDLLDKAAGKWMRSKSSS
jgi:hypothetical protein